MRLFYTFLCSCLYSSLTAGLAGICRFGTSSPVILALEAANRNQLMIHDSTPQLLEVVPPYPQGATQESRTDDSGDGALDSSRHNYLYDRPLSSFPQEVDTQDEDEMVANCSSPLSGRSRSFPSYEPGCRYSCERAGQRCSKNLSQSPSDGTTSTASSLDADDIHFLSVTVPE